MPALADTAGFVDRVINQCGKGGVRIRTVLLDREFSVGVIGVLERAGVGYLMPCSNTDGVVGAIREFAAGRRPAVSTNTIRKSKKQASTSNPEDIYIAFATNRPDIHLEKYACRWMIETGYRMIENQRVRTRSRTVAARTLCFLYSMLIYNIWVIANASTTNNRVYPRVTQTDLLLNILVEMFPWELITGVPPDGQCGCACSCHRASPANIMPV